MKHYRPRTRRFAVMAVATCLGLLVPDRGAAQDDIIAKFLPRSHTFNGATIVYRLFVPEDYNPAQKYPVVLTLHGNGAQGSDNLSQLMGTRLATSWADSVNQAQYPCFVVSPQCRAGFYWNDPWLGDLGAANNILDSLAREFPIDTTRMYVTGLSMGGWGTWLLIYAYPDRFAAAVPVSMDWPAIDELRIADIPLWVFTGAADGLVPVEGVRAIVNFIKESGRPLVYTHCNPVNCTGLSDSTIAWHVRTHADFFYTEQQFGGHDQPFFNFAYDYPHLRPWMFDKIRLTRGLVNVTNLKGYRALRGTEPIAWTAPEPTDSVEIRFSGDGGFVWRTVEKSLPNTGSYYWNTLAVDDCPFGQLKLILKNSGGQPYRYDLTSYFAVDNGTQGKPFAKILNADFFIFTTIQDTAAVEMRYLAGSSKPGPLTVRYYYSSDLGASFALFDSSSTQGDTTGLGRMLNLAPLANSDNAAIRLEVSDGVSVSSDTTSLLYPMWKRTPRLSGPVPFADHSFGNGQISVRVINASQLTGDLYRITFESVPGIGTRYDVTNETKGMLVAENVRELDGVTEGPMFDGIRLVVRNYAKPEINRDSSRWEIGASTLLEVQVGIPSSSLGGMAYPADYRITFHSQIVDTSSDAILGMGRIPVNFTVFNTTENRKSEFVFMDSDGNQQLSGMDDIVILERDSLGELHLSWDLLFVPVPPQTSVPGPGDQYVLRTLKPFRSGDSFTFRGTLTSVGAPTLPGQMTLSQNFPNPFNPATTIRYEVPERAPGSASSAVGVVRLVVYDILGRQVATLVNEKKVPGRYEVTFNASGLASGVYLYRLSAGDFVQTRKMILIK